MIAIAIQVGFSRFFFQIFFAIKFWIAIHFFFSDPFEMIRCQETSPLPGGRRFWVHLRRFRRRRWTLPVKKLWFRQAEASEMEKKWTWNESNTIVSSLTLAVRNFGKTKLDFFGRIATEPYLFNSFSGSGQDFSDQHLGIRCCSLAEKTKAALRESCKFGSRLISTTQRDFACGHRGLCFFYEVFYALTCRSKHNKLLKPAVSTQLRGEGGWLWHTGDRPGAGSWTAVMWPAVKLEERVVLPVGSSNMENWKINHFDQFCIIYIVIHVYSCSVKLTICFLFTHTPIIFRLL